jgi:hypothetical protein
MQQEPSRLLIGRFGADSRHFLQIRAIFYRFAPFFPRVMQLQVVTSCGSLSECISGINFAAKKFLRCLSDIKQKSLHRNTRRIDFSTAQLSIKEN